MGYELGIGPAHLQHSCIYLLDLTTQCNLTCPACFTSSSPHATSYLPLANVERAVKTAIARENGHLDVVMLSGGEPTVHPAFREIVERLAPLPITRILVNTNGLRLANEDGLLDFLASYRDRIEIYLQYDGQEEAVQRVLARPGLARAQDACGRAAFASQGSSRPSR